ncbi:hypothetical protein ACIQC7_34840 [Kitasatospora sp. NPDC088556]|uniref:hypothetical protein n=1 Tax=Kitasatospora sp. NPDC088556 TaxID=3364076 RepID=UPI0037F4F8FC
MTTMTHALDQTYQRIGTTKAAALYRQALDLYRDRSPHDHLRVSTALARLSGVHT